MQKMVPTGAPTVVGWTGSAADVADAGGVNDATYIESPLSPTSASYWDCALSAVTDPQIDDGLVLRFRQALNATGGDAKQVTVRIYRASDNATVVQQAVPVGYPTGDAPPVTLTPQQAALIASYGSGSLRVRVSATGSAKQLLTSTDLAYIGGFRLPGYRSPVRCLTGRTIGGVTHLFCTLPYDYGADVLEVLVPSLVSPPQDGVQATILQRYPTASFYYGVGGVNKWWYGDDQGHGVAMTTYWPKALYWDAEDQRLYWSYGTNSTDDYSTLTAYTNEPWFNSFGASTVDVATGACQAIGSWGTSALRVKARNSGMLGVPAWFADAYLGGRRLAVGFGGIRSIVTSGDCSVAPTLVAIDTPSAATNRVALPGTTLLYYPYVSNGAPYLPDLTHPYRPHRDTGYTDEFNGWNPIGTVGFWDWRQRFFGALVWVDTPTKTGLLLNINQGMGRGWYEASDLRSQGGADVGYIWSPYDLIPVAQGASETWWPQPTEFWRWPGGYTGRYSDPTSADSNGWWGHSYDYGASVWFDPVASRVYVSRYEPTLENNVVSVYEVT